MKRIVWTIVCVVPIFLFGQTKVDVLVSRLDALSQLPMDDWKYTTRITGGQAEVSEYSQPGFDDSNWEDLSLGQSIYVDSCWLRKEIVLPRYIAGVPVEGPIQFLVSVDDYGYLWVNGESKGYFPWDGEFELVRNAEPGMTLVLLIRAINTGGPLRLIRAKATSDAMAPTQEKIQNVVLGLRVGQKLLGFDTYQTNARVKTDPGVDKSRMDREEKKRVSELLQRITEEIDVHALADGDMSRFWRSVDAFHAKAKPVSDFVRQFTLYFDSNAHIDAAWLWRSKETIEVCNRTFGSVMNMMNARPDFTYTQSQAALYDWMVRYYPDLFRQIQDREKEGRWEIIGGMWVEPDCNLPSGVSWARQLLYGQRFFQKHFGKKVQIGWNPDSFGYNWNMPQFFLNAGIDAFITQKIGWNDTSVFPYRAFWWQAPDDSRILAYFPFSYVDRIENPFRLVDWLRQFEANTGFTKLMILFGVGDHGGGPSLEMMERIDRLKTVDIFPEVVFGTASQYLAWMKDQDLSDLPVWESELYLEYHRGTYTTQANTKKWNRRSEVLLTNAEKFSALATMAGRPYNQADLEEAWQTVCFNQFHDILPGSSIREVYFDADKSYREAHAIGKHELMGASKAIAKQINTEGLPQGKPVVVFNPLAWNRTDIVRVRLAAGDTDDYAIYDQTGKEIPSQIVAQGKYHRDVLFVAEDVPSLGYEVYVLRAGKPAIAKSALTISETTVENEIFRVTVDPDSGWITSILDKGSGRELLDGYGNRLQLFEDKPTAWDAWNIGLGTEYPSQFRRIEVVEEGPVRAVLRLHRDFLKPGVQKSYPTEDFPSSFFVQDIVLIRGVDRVDFRTDVEWWENKTMLKVAFPVSVRDTMATYEIPYGSIERSTTLTHPLDRGKWEVPALHWADVSDDGYGITLLTDSKYGYDIKGNVMRLSLLRSPEWPDPTADRGDHSIAYALYPHEGDWRESQTVRRGYEFNTPLIPVMTGIHGGELPKLRSFIRLEPDNLVLTTVKRAERQDDAWIVQWYEAIGEHTRAMLTLPMKPKRAFVSNFLEEEGEPVSFDGNTINLETRKHGISTIKVVF